MTKKTRRIHSAALKAKVALEALREDRTLSEIAQAYEIHPNQVAAWREQLLDYAEEAFKKGKKDPGPDIRAMEAKIGQLTMENDFLSNALGRMGLLSAKK